MAHTIGRVGDLRIASDKAVNYSSSAIYLAVSDDDHVLHLCSPMAVLSNSSIFVETNVRGVQVLLEACRKSGVRFQQISTDEVYGSCVEGSFAGTNALGPSSPSSRVLERRRKSQRDVFLLRERLYHADCDSALPSSLSQEEGNRMRVLFLATQGADRRAFLLANELAKIGHTTTLVSSAKSNSLKVGVSREGSVTRVSLPRFQRTYDYAGYLVRTFFMPWFVLTRADVIHFFSPHQPSVSLSFMLAHILNRITKEMALVVDWDDQWGRGGLSIEHGALVHGGATFLEERIPLRAHAVTAATIMLVKRAEAIGVPSHRVFWIPHGSEAFAEQGPIAKHEARRILNIPDTNVLILHMGRFTTPFYGRIVIGCAEKLLKDYHHIHLLLLGDIGRTLGSETQLPKDRVMAFFASERLLPLYLSAADIALMPLEDTPFERARLPLRLCDYMAAGLPVVASPIGEVGRVVARYGVGVLVRKNTAEEFGNSVAELINDEELRLKLGRNGQETAEHIFSWKKSALKLSELYDRSCSNV